MKDPQVAVIIPCFNEAITIGKVIDDFRTTLPQATIYVFDNNSTDNTSKIAKEKDATVLRETRQGKGFVVQSMFRRVDADYYIMVDGDDTYPANCAKSLLAPVMSGEYDMTAGRRVPNDKKQSYRKFHFFGNLLITTIINFLFDIHLRDILTGYRCFSRTYVKSCPVLSEGFEIETELTLQALNKRFNILEVDVSYGKRPEGSLSKLSTFKDGLIIIKTIFRIFRDYKPLLFFFSISFIGIILGGITGGVVVNEYIATQYITHVPLAIFSVGSILSSFLFAGIGLVLDTINRRFDELFDSTVKTSAKNRS